MNKLAQRQMFLGNHRVSIGLTGDLGYVEIEDQGLYPDGDSRADRRDLGFNKIMISLMTREQLKNLKIAIEEVLKNSK
jgi:hypothetical protein